MASWERSCSDSSTSAQTGSRSSRSRRPRSSQEQDIDAEEAVFIREHNRAKAERPNPSVALKPDDEKHPDAALLVAVHEHRWVGGHCVHGCPDTRD
jgi:hypothetical protein